MNAYVFTEEDECRTVRTVVHASSEEGAWGELREFFFPGGDEDGDFYPGAFAMHIAEDGEIECMEFDSPDSFDTLVC